MYLQLIDVQQEHSTSTREKAASVTARWETAVNKSPSSRNTQIYFSMPSIERQIKCLFLFDSVPNYKSDGKTLFTSNIPSPNTAGTNPTNEDSDPADAAMHD